ncbi:flagellar basal-body rod protein FlgB [Thermosipho africanus H17ap60334]|jgi:flagellar basal-body rod protein FlgB|uniref:Flagellar basal body rod protein FlgB n=1 Tax=Thermosipho africanus (strain TCF52B) TaxID=484019 RepID=B7ICZ6_THEAB|nr:MULTISPECIES: flagellar basal body rod protein FlgB [Thermosipho]ACJ75873.1 flagellar basal-body rod protein FlgB [Thermosipho africanus TCF52B]EKF49883.1 flagellar basal-body rod protein FlgB [Thermosipho africanus H17ap60334]MBZ4650088.1 flgB [Thermosipho sp. (in: thermotogales)]MDK2838938.1 flagellar basal-body rod protein FlgB [Thermosipho sp. (in: thermotogales)]MDK2899658.1 flagellar basal-body rod protein FlgB [Thermosipho sp. (in: thermotogales)]
MFNSNFSTLKAAMDVALKRQEIHSQNIANAETPNYKRKYIVFEELLNESKMKLSLKTTSGKHIERTPKVVNPIIKAQKNTSLTNDGNNVDIDIEMVEMVKNALRYQTLSRLMSANIDRYNTVIRNIR